MMAFQSEHFSQTLAWQDDKMLTQIGGSFVRGGEEKMFRIVSELDLSETSQVKCRLVLKNPMFLESSF